MAVAECPASFVRLPTVFPKLTTYADGTPKDLQEVVKFTAQVDAHFDPLGELLAHRQEHHRSRSAMRSLIGLPSVADSSGDECSQTKTFDFTGLNSVIGVNLIPPAAQEFNPCSAKETCVNCF